LLSCAGTNGISGGLSALPAGKKLAVYAAAEFSHVRVEACDTCGGYIKIVDLTKDGHAIPAVDELATIPLNLWAAEHGYAKLQTNIFGI
jgi:formate dehydrogenase maturation protein FdhE